jgi:hypothetical protein
MFSILAQLLLYQLELQLPLHLQPESLQAIYLLRRLLQAKFVPKKQQQPSKTAQIAKISFQHRLSVLILGAKLSNNEQQSYSLSKKEEHLLGCVELLGGEGWNMQPLGLE